MERDRQIVLLRQPLAIAALRRYVSTPIVSLQVHHSRALERVGVKTAWEVIARLPPGDEVTLSRWRDRESARSAAGRYRRAAQQKGVRAFWEAVFEDRGGIAKRGGRHEGRRG